MAVAWGLAVGAAPGVAVADEPQANSRATNSRTIALGQCLNNCDLDVDFGTVPSPVLRLRIRTLDMRNIAVYAKTSHDV